MAIATPRPWSRWNVQQRVFALLLGALAAMAVAAGISVSLAPARISFSVANATTSRVPVQGSPGLLNGFYNLTLVANNTSRRTQVRFAAVSAQIWYSATGYVLAGEVDAAAALPGWRSPRDVAGVAFWAKYGQYDHKAGTARNGKAGKELKAEKATKQDCRLVVEAKVRFKYGLAVTMPYTIRVSCFHVNFSSSSNVSVQCS
ncbi:hypothetical protein PVAP13_4KG006572 [Panicum virgatum]|uniref:Late embryogenesis abundant protein LEA-2 subgroup domain-containing protein n=1 Tax=Panicum virgatum TaxID=38727 RepID=A0A8T0TFL0_PANVG|nr:hypothetical protein PVAP13_4KG006572 [Panicum virgatum]